MSNSFVNYLNTIVPLPPQCVESIKNRIEQFSFPKKHVILREGQVCRYLYFVESGLVRLYYNKDGNDITDYFAFENNFIGGIASFFSQKPSDKAIETIEETTVHALKYIDLEMLYDQHHSLERLGRLLTTHAFLSMQDRLHAIQFHTAKERYTQLVSRSPDALKRIPLGYIASYLGVTQTTLSRIRANF